jgi:hypothetical protein
MTTMTVAHVLEIIYCSRQVHSASTLNILILIKFNREIVRKNNYFQIHLRHNSAGFEFVLFKDKGKGL